VSSVPCIVRIDALEAFTAFVETQIPTLAGRTCAGQAPSSEMERVPNLSIEPSRWMYNPDTVEIVRSLPGNVLVYQVGWHEAACVVSVIASSPRQRAALEAQVIDLFLSAKHPLSGMHQPGLLAFTVTACPEVGEWQTYFELDADEWVETLALDRRYESRILVDVSVPALTVDAPVYSITSLILGVSGDSTSSAGVVELVTINEDGTLSPA
jgi:hypothetical protein